MIFFNEKQIESKLTAIIKLFVIKILFIIISNFQTVTIDRIKNSIVKTAYKNLKIAYNEIFLNYKAALIKSKNL